MIKNWSQFIINELLEFERIQDVENFYQARCRKDINHPDSVGWINRNSQEYRFEVFTNFIKDGDKVLDYGCGVGDFYNYLKLKYKNFDYMGVDIQKYMINNAGKKYPDAEFKLVRGVDDINQKFNWVVASGVFTIGMDKMDVLEFFKKASDISTDGVMANFLQTYKDVINTSGRYIEYNKDLLKKFLEENLNIELISIDDYCKKLNFFNRDKDFTLIFKKQL